MKDIKLYAVTHKKTEDNIKDRTYIHVGVGKDSDFLCDNTGENITDKNPYFCELTAIYWIWKNTSSDIVGIEHYRRLFGFNIFHGNDSFIMYKDEISKLLDKYEIILPKKGYFDKTILERYKENLDEHDFDLVSQIIEKQCPEYLPFLNKVLNSKSAGMCNMMICKKSIYDSYCEWLFNILFELEKQIDPSIREGYRKRTYGYISERLMDVWVEKNQLSVIRKPMMRNDKGKLMTLLRYFKSCFKSLFKISLKGNPMEGK